LESSLSGSSSIAPLKFFPSICHHVAGDAIGMPRPPPFLDPTLDANMIMEKGVNYASGGGGILNETGRHFVSIISIYRLHVPTIVVNYY